MCSIFYHRARADPELFRRREAAFTAAKEDAQGDR
jgi:hypothetical protein